MDRDVVLLLDLAREVQPCVQVERGGEGESYLAVTFVPEFEDDLLVDVAWGVEWLHRKLKPRHIQLIGIGGTIGTALYVQIGRGLLNGGPGSLFMAFTIW